MGAACRDPAWMCVFPLANSLAGSSSVEQLMFGCEGKRSAVGEATENSYANIRGPSFFLYVFNSIFLITSILQSGMC
jgi:hypothetical protein